MGDKYLSEVIDYERDMKKHHFMAIYSGVGSGKNRFIDSFYKEDKDIPNPQMTVLVITSRRAKANETLAENVEYLEGSIGHWGNVHRVKEENETEEEFSEGHIDGAILIPDYEIADKAEKILTDKDQLILVYCRSGRRSKLAADSLVTMGYTNIKEFGGIIDWPYDVVTK